MHQYADVGNIIGVITCNLEVIDMDGAFQDLVLDFLDNDILTIDENQYVAGTKLDCICPALYRRVEGMGRRGNDLLVAYKDMDQFGSLIDIGFRDPAQGFLASLFIPGLDIITNHNILNRFTSLFL